MVLLLHPPYHLLSHPRKSQKIRVHNLFFFLYFSFPIHSLILLPDAEPQAITAPSASSEGAQTAPPKTDKKKKAPQIEDAKVVTISVHHRSKKKKITEITGLQAFGLKPKDLIKFFSNKFACSVSVNKAKADEIDVQGDFSYDVAEILQEKYSVGFLSFIF